jgi:hypothetical protein
MKIIDFLQIFAPLFAVLVGVLLALKKSTPEVRSLTGNAIKSYADAAETAGKLANDAIERSADLERRLKILEQMQCYRIIIEVKAGEDPEVKEVTIERLPCTRDEPSKKE